MDELFEMHHDTAINKKFCKILLEKGVDVNACTKEGKSALLMAVEQVHLVYLGQIPSKCPGMAVHSIPVISPVK